MSLTLKNFGILCKSVYFHFPVVVANCGDSSYELLAEVLLPVRQAVSAILVAKGINIKGTWIKVVFKIGITCIVISFNIILGSDEKCLRILCGLAGCGTIWCCFLCYLQRTLTFGSRQLIDLK